MSTKKDQLEIKIDITDWQEEAQLRETIIEKEKDIIDLIRNGRNMPEVARATVVCREKGIAPGDIIKPNKSLISMAAQSNIVEIIHRQRHEVTTPGGSTFSQPDMIGRIGRPSIELEPEVLDMDGTDPDISDDGPSFVDKSNKLFLDRAIGYCEKVLPGHITSHLVQIYESGGNVEEAAQNLHDAINEIVAKISG